MATILINSCLVNVQDTLQSHIENGKFYGIFPVDGDYVVYTDTVAVIGQISKEGINNKATAFFSRNEDSKYYFESESQDTSDLVYQGVLSKGVMSQKSDVHFSIGVHFTDSICQFRISEVVFDLSRDQTAPVIGGTGDKTHIIGSVKTGTIDGAISLENIDINKGEFSKRYCQKINDKFTKIMQDLKNALR